MDQWDLCCLPLFGLLLFLSNSTGAKIHPLTVTLRFSSRISTRVEEGGGWVITNSHIWMGSGQRREASINAFICFRRLSKQHRLSDFQFDSAADKKSRNRIQDGWILSDVYYFGFVSFHKKKLRANVTDLQTNDAIKHYSCGVLGKFLFFFFRCVYFSCLNRNWFLPDIIAIKTKISIFTVE